MIDRAHEFAKVRAPMLLLAASAWVLLLADPGGRVAAHCAAMATAGMPALAVGWALMLVAMMSPAMIPAVVHIRVSSLRRRRARLVAVFALGYAAVWTAAGVLLTAVEVAIQPSYLAAGVVALVALVWQVSPAKQCCLNRCHSHPELSAFGIAADLDALHFGLTHGGWCAGSCWAVMLVPMLLPAGHLPAMAAATVLIFGERLENPRPPAWRWRGFGKLTRLLSAQARMWLAARTQSGMHSRPPSATPAR